MAYVSQEMKKELSGGIKAVLKKYGMKGTIAVDNHSSLVVNLKGGKLDLLGVAQQHNDLVAEQRGQQSYPIGDHLQVNNYYAEEWANEVGEPEVANFYGELVKAMKAPTSRGEWYNKSDIMTDYFDIAYYTNINAGQWNKPYEYAPC